MQKDDVIYRQAAIYAAHRADCTELAIEDVKKVTDEVIKELKQLPPAQPAPCEFCKHNDIADEVICLRCPAERWEE